MVSHEDSDSSSDSSSDLSQYADSNLHQWIQQTFSKYPLDSIAKIGGLFGATHSHSRRWAQQVMDAGVVPRIFALLQKNSHYDVQMLVSGYLRPSLNSTVDVPDILQCIQTTCQLDNINIDDALHDKCLHLVINLPCVHSEADRYLLQHDALSILVRLLTSERTTVSGKSNVCWALANICGDLDAERRAIMFESNLCGEMLSILASTDVIAATALDEDKLEFLRYSTMALSEIVRNCRVTDLLQSNNFEQRVLDAATTILLQGISDDDITTNVVSTLRRLPVDVWEKLAIANGFVVKCVELLHHSCENIQADALVTLGNILSTEGHTCTQALLDAGLFVKLESLLTSTDFEQQHFACWMLSNVAAEGCQKIECLLKQNLLCPVLEILGSATPGTAVEALYVVCKAAESGSVEQVQQMMLDNDVKSSLAAFLPKLNKTNRLLKALEALRIMLHGKRAISALKPLKETIFTHFIGLVKKRQDVSFINDEARNRILDILHLCDDQNAPATCSGTSYLNGSHSWFSPESGACNNTSTLIGFLRLHFGSIADNLQKKLQTKAGVNDLDTLIYLDDNDLDLICDAIDLTIIERIRFKCEVRKLQDMHRPRYIVTISPTELSYIDGIRNAIKQCGNIKLLYHTYMQQLDDMAADTKNQIDSSISHAIQALEARKATLHQQVQQWKADNVEAVNTELSIVANDEVRLKSCQADIDALLKKSVANREQKMKQIVAAVFDQANSKNDTKLLLKRVRARTRELRFDCETTLASRLSSSYGTLYRSDVPDSTLQIPGVSLSSISDFGDGGLILTFKHDAEQAYGFLIKFKQACADTDWVVVQKPQIVEEGERKFVAVIRDLENGSYLFTVDCMIEKPLHMSISSNCLSYNYCAVSADEELSGSDD